VKLAGELQSALGPNVLSTAGQTSWGQLAGLLQRAKFFVGVDTAAMHLAAACGCPTVAIFGPSNPAEWRPWQVPHRLVRPHGTACLESGPVDDNDVAQRKTQDVKLADVVRACDELLYPPAQPLPASRL